MKDKFEYFMERTEKDLDHIRTKVDKLWEFRLMLLGGSAVVSVLFSGIFHLASIYWGAR
jgi:hypothetical protein